MTSVMRRAPKGVKWERIKGRFGFGGTSVREGGLRK